MTRLGFLVSGLGGSQMAYHILNEGRRYLAGAEHDDLDIIVFYQNLAKPWTTPMFGVMNISEAFGFDGVVVATDLATAARMRGFPGPSGKYFYVWDLEWVGQEGKAYGEFASVYRDPSITLLARSKSHADLIESCWNRPVHGVVENFNIEQIKEVVNVQRL